MQRTSRLLNEAKEFGAFKPKAVMGKLPNIKNIPPTALNLPHHPRYKYPAQTLLRSIDLEQRYRLDSNDRTKMFFSEEESVKPGSIILVDQILSRTSNQVKSFAGVYVGKTRKGQLSAITLKSLVLGVGVTMKIPIYSPMVSRFVVLKESVLDDIDQDFLTPEQVDKINFEEIEHLMIKFKNQESRGLLGKK